MPIIDELLARQIEVVLAGDGLALELLKKTYPQLPAEPLPGYEVEYARNHQHTLKLLKQFPRILKAIRAEHEALLDLAVRYRIDGIISDNRYGLWHPQIPTAFMCHQLAAIPPSSLRFLRKPVQRFHMKQINQFDVCWVPDYPGEDNLSGSLSHTPPLPPHARFLGPLSRFAHYQPNGQGFSFPELNDAPIDVVAVLSGPEPQRTLLETLILEQASQLDRPFWLVQGLTDRREIKKVGNAWVISFMKTHDLALIFRHARVILSRSGYSSLMDYASLGLRQMILVPTPGQTEQEYLAERLHDEGLAFSCPQEDFKLLAAMEGVQATKGFTRPFETGRMTGALDDLLLAARQYHQENNTRVSS